MKRLYTQVSTSSPPRLPALGGGLISLQRGLCWYDSTKKYSETAITEYSIHSMFKKEEEFWNQSRTSVNLYTITENLRLWIRLIVTTEITWATSDLKHERCNRLFPPSIVAIINQQQTNRFSYSMTHFQDTVNCQHRGSEL